MATRRQAGNWTSIGASSFVIRMLTYGIWDPPTSTFREGIVLPTVPQSATDLSFAEQELEEGCSVGTYQKVPDAYALEQVRHGAYVSSAFVNWNNGNGRFVININFNPLIGTNARFSWSQ